MEGGWKPNVETTPNCPRCGSCNTKFCYYNNYSLTQPRYFCKGCRRYWTKGGSLRNVPVGGGCRKSRRSGKSIRASSTDHHHHPRFPSRAFSLAEPTSSSTMTPDQGGSTIDLAQVYANFLNQRPEPPPKSRLEMPEFPGDHFDQVPFQFSNLSNVQWDFGITHFPLEHSLIGCGTISDRLSETHRSDGGAMYLCGALDLVDKQQETINQFTSDHHLISGNCGLPPLPGEEACPTDMGWFSSEMMHVSQVPGIEFSESQHSDQLLGNYKSSSLGMSTSYGTPFRP